MCVTLLGVTICITRATGRKETEPPAHWPHLNPDELLEQARYKALLLQVTGDGRQGR